MRKSDTYDPARARRQTVVVLLLAALGLRIFLSYIPFHREIDRELTGVYWDAWGVEQDTVTIHIRGERTAQLGKPLEFIGDVEIDGIPESVPGERNFVMLQLQPSEHHRGLRTGTLDYGNLIDRTPIGDLYTDPSFSKVIIVFANKERPVLLAAPAQTREEAVALLKEYQFLLEGGTPSLLW